MKKKRLKRMILSDNDVQFSNDSETEKSAFSEDERLTGKRKRKNRFKMKYFISRKK